MPTVQHEINLSNYLLKNGPKFCTHVAVIKDDLFYFKPTSKSIAYSMIYFVMAIVLFIGAMIVFQHTGKLDLPLFLTGFGLGIGLLGLKVTGDYLALIKFDKSHGAYERKHYRPVALDNIVGLQINQKQQLSYACYELNLLTKGGRRMNILNHNGLAEMRREGKQLAEFLGLPPEDFKDYARLKDTA